MAKSMSVCLEEAADLIEKEGWDQGWFGKPEPVGPHCMIGACKAVCPDRAKSYDPWAIALGFGPRYEAGYMYWTAADAAFNWNDTNGRTKKQVIARLREYAGVVRQKEQGLDV